MVRQTFVEELTENRAAYLALRSQIRREHTGSYVAIAAGRLVGTGGSYDEALAAVHALSPAPEHYIVFAADSEPAFDIVDDFAGWCSPWGV